MRIVLATGIYPPQIGGPATYVRELAGRLKARGAEVCVVTFGEESASTDEGWPVHAVSRVGGPLLRWWRYANVLRAVAADSDIVYAFSAVSAGVPLFLSRLRTPRRVLRLGGDFGWERATDKGVQQPLAEWYGEKPNVQRPMELLLKQFHHIVFSTAFQESLYERQYGHLPTHSVIENALPQNEPVLHQRHTPFKLLFLGRFVAFKNILSLIDAVALVPDCTLTLIGEGPEEGHLRRLIAKRGLQERVNIESPVQGQDKRTVFLSHDALILPSFTEISPNAALEARSLGLPVVLTEETGLSLSLRQGMVVTSLRSPEQIVTALKLLLSDYDSCAARAAAPLPSRPWEAVADEHMSLFQGLL